MFDKLWNKEHLAEAHHSDTDDDYNDQDSLNPSSSTQIQRGVDASTKLLYSKGAKIVEKMGYQGSGGLGPSGEGVWLPPQPPAIVPKHGQNQALGMEINHQLSQFHLYWIHLSLLNFFLLHLQFHFQALRFNLNQLSLP